MGSLSEFKSSEAERGLTSGGAALPAKSWSLHWWLGRSSPISHHRRLPLAVTRQIGIRTVRYRLA